MTIKWMTLAAALVLSPPLFAQKPPAAPAAATAPLTEGVVRKIDADAGKVTLKHGPIVNLDMPGMTMVFRVVSPTLLAGLKVGDAVQFRVEKINGVYTVTSLKTAN